MTLIKNTFLMLTLPLFIMSYISPVFAEETTSNIANPTFAEMAENILSQIVYYMEVVLFFPIFGVPFLVLWLIAGGIFFTFKLGFVNIRLFGHAISCVRGKYSSKNDPGEITHFAALAAAVSATVGLGNIGGVAVAVTMGGPGAVVWMAIAGLFAMSTKMAEVTMGQKYRVFDENGKVSGGAFHYLSKGLAEKGMARFGKILAIIFAIFCIGGSLGGGNMYQSNQTVSILTNTFDFLKEADWIIALVLSITVGMVLIGGIRRIAKVAEAVVPLMALVYIASALVILLVNIEHLGEAFRIMLSDAFSGEAVGGGLLGAIIAGVKRASFSNEAGLGSAPIAHSAAKTKEPVREGCVALLEPFIDTVVICFLTGLVITVTGVYQDESVGKGVLMTSAAFETVIDWFPMVLSVAIILFAYSTMITWSYYGERAWEYLFGKNKIRIYHVIFITATFIGGVVQLDIVIAFSDVLLLSMAIPNLIGLYILSNDLKKDVKKYSDKLKKGQFKRIK